MGKPEKPPRNEFLILLFLILAQPGYAQSFINLGFESATLPSLPTGQYGSYVPSTNALPGWSPNLAVLQNNADIGTAAIDLLGPHLSASQSNILFGGVIEGNYSAVLQAGFDQSSGTSVLVDASITQTGLVPTDAQSIRVKVRAPGLFVIFAGQNLPLVTLATENTYVLVGADISQFAGQVGSLTFSTSIAFAHHSYDVPFDSIVFSLQQIPEPNSLALLNIGILLFGFFRRRTSSR